LTIDRKWLKELRQQKGFTQEDLAEIIGITRQHIGMIENGNSNPSPKLAKKIAKALNFNWTKFYEDDPKASNE
jgi:transcriptional regulator with XRE-family HTH domain